MFFYVIFQIFTGWIYGYIMEYVFHRWIFHSNRLGKNKNSIFSFHFREHHRKSRIGKMRDKTYDKITITGCSSSKKEIIGLMFVNVIHFPIIFIFPFAYLSMMLNSVHYFYMHRKSHVDIEWSKKNMPWHYDHHLGIDQDSNYGIRSDIIDRLLFTKKPYLGTVRYIMDEKKRLKEPYLKIVK